jgi:hypothetical protein
MGRGADRDFWMEQNGLAASADNARAVSALVDSAAAAASMEVAEAAEGDKEERI